MLALYWTGVTSFVVAMVMPIRGVQVLCLQCNLNSSLPNLDADCRLTNIRDVEWYAKYRKYLKIESLVGCLTVILFYLIYIIPFVFFIHSLCIPFAFLLISYAFHFHSLYIPFAFLLRFLYVYIFYSGTETSKKEWWQNEKGMKAEWTENEGYKTLIRLIKRLHLKDFYLKSWSKNQN